MADPNNERNVAGDYTRPDYNRLIKYRQQVDPTKNSLAKVQRKIIKRGTGKFKPSLGQYCTVHYVGTLEDGTEFDNSRKKGKPFSFRLGYGQV